MATQTVRQNSDDFAAELEKCLSHVGPATFAIGDKCIYRRTGKELTITKGYHEYAVKDPDGDIVGRDGRVSRRYGYVAQDCNGKASFFPAGALLDLNDRERHVQLVWPPKPVPVVESKPKKARTYDPFKAPLLKPYADKLDAATRRMMAEAVAEGFANGRTTQDIIASIRRAEVSHA